MQDVWKAMRVTIVLNCRGKGVQFLTTLLKARNEICKLKNLCESTDAK